MTTINGQTVELSIALHYVFNTPEDLLLWDVGHQAYGHKMLTGRREDFQTLRQEGGISGFPKREESEYDAFGTGHAGTTISAALGMALSAKIQGHQRRYPAVSQQWCDHRAAPGGNRGR